MNIGRATTIFRSSNETDCQIFKCLVDYMGKDAITQVIVNRENGIMMFAGADCIATSPNLTCGYDGKSPSYTLEVLRYAGFDVEPAQVFEEEHLDRSK